MHYESLRLRIVEIEHEDSKSQRAAARQSQSAVQQLTQPKSDRGSTHASDAIEDPHDDDIEDQSADLDDAEDVNEGLGLIRFPPGASRPPELIPDTEDDEESTELDSPQEPDTSTIQQALKRPADAELAQQLERVRKCPCHGHKDTSPIENVWHLPPSTNDKPGVTCAVAQVLM